MFKDYYRPEDEFYYFLLSCALNIGMKAYDSLQTVFASPRELFEGGLAEADKMGILNKGQHNRIKALSEDKSRLDEFKRMQDRGINYISRENLLFPKRLLDIADGPLGLFYIGRLPKENFASVAVIGARECSSYGEEVAASLGQALGKYGIQLISGMARGVDSLSQKAAIEQKCPSFGVLGGGVDICYPRESRRLYEDLKKLGGVISEYPPGTQPIAMYFVRRNRIISGLSDEVCVVEARKKSGTMITVDAALEQGRSVVCVPGKITDITSRGCNELIAQGAAILTDVDEYAAECATRYGSIREGAEHTGNNDTEQNAAKLSLEEKNLIKVLGDGEFSPGDAAASCREEFGKTLLVCLSLCDKTILKNQGAGKFKLTSLGLKIRNTLME